MDQEGVDAVQVHTGYGFGARLWAQHQVRHRDRTSPELCKVLHIEKTWRKSGSGMLFSTKGLFFMLGLSLGRVRATLSAEGNCAEVG